MTHIPPSRCPGPGDEVTWPAFSGNPNDPRCPEDMEYEDCTTRSERIKWLEDHCDEHEIAEWLVDEREAQENFVAAVLWIVKGVTHDDAVVAAIKAKAIYYGLRQP